MFALFRSVGVDFGGELPSMRASDRGAAAIYSRGSSVATATLEDEWRQDAMALQVVDGDARSVSRMADHCAICRLTRP